MIFPSFRIETLDELKHERCRWLQRFPFQTKGKRKDDFIAFGSGKSSKLILYENPRNHDFDEGIEDEDELTRWRPMVIDDIRYGSSCQPVDITGNGFNDLIMTTDYGESFDAMDHFGGRVCWFENFGTDEGGWTRRDIGRFPGVNLVKVGHFSSTFSLQILALVTSPNPAVKAPLLVFTRPADIYTARFWHITLNLEDAFTAIQDCLVVKGATGCLDRFIISSREGLSLVSYSDQSWVYTPLVCSPTCTNPGKMAAFRRGTEDLAGIICCSANEGATLHFLERKDNTYHSYDDAERVGWVCRLLEDFSDDYPQATISDLICVDLNKDNNDEIVVAVNGAGRHSGIYCYVQQCNEFVKYKISNECAIRITPGMFDTKDIFDFATVSPTDPQRFRIHYQSFVHSEIRPIVRGPELLFNISRSPSLPCEVEIMSIAGYLLSLVVLPANAFFDISPDENDAIKVLYGTVAWIDSQSVLIERTRASGLPGCAVPMLVDAPAGDVHSGNEGAMFIRLRTSSITTKTSSLDVLNVLPSHFPYEICEYRFEWERDGESADIMHLPGFRVRFDDANDDEQDIAYVHFFAAKIGTPYTLSNNIPYPTSGPPAENTSEMSCNIRACLANPSGDGGVLYMPEGLDRSSSPPSPFHLYRAKKLILPLMHEHGPLWKPSARALHDDDDTEIEYPWHAWTSASGDKDREVDKKHLWMSFDFPCSSLSKEEMYRTGKSGGCIIC